MMLKTETQGHAYLIDRKTPYGMIVTTNMYFLTMLDPKDRHCMLVDGPYWREELSEGPKSEMWKRLCRQCKAKGVNIQDWRHPWEIAGADLTRMRDAGYGGESTCEKLFSHAVHAMLV